MVLGQLPEEGEVQVGSVALPAGVRIVAGYGTGQPVAWATIEPVSEPYQLWAALTAAHPQTGLVPFLLEGMASNPDDTQRPWDEGELDDCAGVDELDQLDAAALLESWWNEHLNPLVEGQPEDPASILVRLPFGRQFPGLASAETMPRDPRTLKIAMSMWQRPTRIGLAVAQRPADVLVRIGWTGANATTLPIAAVLRSWEDRFGARLLQIGFDRIRILVQRPPRTADAALRLAAEHYVFADECQHETYVRGTVPDLALWVLNLPLWTFWWD